MVNAVLGFEVRTGNLKQAVDQLKTLPGAASLAERAAERLAAGGSRAFARLSQEATRAAARIRGTLAKITTDFNTMPASFAGGFIGSIAAGFSVNAAKQLVDQATRIQNALKVAGLAGADLDKVYQRLYASAQKNGAPLESLATLYGRAAQQQKELGVSTEQLLKFTDDVSLALRVAGTDAATASGALLQLGQALGSGVVHAEEFNSILEGAAPIAQAAAAGIKEAGGSVAKLKQLVNDGKISSRAFFDGFASGAGMLADKAANAETTISAGFVRLQNVMVDVAKRFDDSTHASRTLANMIDNTLIPAIQELGGIFTGITNGPIGEFYDWLGKTIDRVVQLSADLGAMTGLDQIGGNPYIGQGRIQERIDGAFAGTTYTTPKGSRGGTELTVTKGTVEKPITLADYPVTGSAKKGGGGRGIKKSSDDAFEEDLQALRDRTEALRVEQATLGMTFQEQQKRKVSLDLEQQALKDVREAARRKGEVDWQNKELSPAQVKAIDEVSDAYARQADSLRKAQEMQELQRDVLKGVFSDFRSAWADGKIDAQEWADIATNALDKVISKIEDDLVDAILNVNKAGSQGGGGGLFGFLGGLFGGTGLGSLQMFPGGMGFVNSTGGLYDTGGYTGPGGVKQPAGVVHKGEIVWSQSDIRRAGGVAAVEGMRRGMPTFDRGGIVGDAMSPAVAAGNMGGFGEVLA